MNRASKRIGEALALAAFIVMIGFVLIAVSGCADPTAQYLDVGSRGIDGVPCTLSNDKGVWHFVTPARVLVKRSSAPMKLSCEANGMTLQQELPAADVPLLDRALIVANKPTYSSAGGEAYKMERKP